MLLFTNMFESLSESYKNANNIKTIAENVYLTLSDLRCSTHRYRINGMRINYIQI